MINSFEKLVAPGVWVNLVAFSLFGCTKTPVSEISGSEAQYNTPANKVLRYAGHASDCAVETIDDNSTTTFGEYRATLDRGWAQGVDLYLQNPQDPSSLVCYHPNRYISGQSKMVRPVVSIDGQTPQTPQGQSFANQAPVQPTFRYVTAGNRNFIGYEVTPGGCSNTNQGGGNDCVIWGVVRANNRVSLVNGSCLGGYRISDIAPGIDRSRLFANQGFRDLRGTPLDGCFILARREWTRQIPQWSESWDGPIPPYYSGQNSGSYPYSPPNQNPGYNGQNNGGQGYPPGGGQGYPPGGPGYVQGGGQGYPPGGPGYVQGGPGYPPGGPGYGPGFGPGYGAGGGPGYGPGYGPGVGPGGGPVITAGCAPGTVGIPGCGAVGPGPGMAPYPWNSGHAYFPGFVDYELPTPGEVLAFGAVDMLMNAGQYALCRNAAPDNYVVASGLACRIGGFLGSGPAFPQCIAACQQIFVQAQAQKATDWQTYQ